MSSHANAKPMITDVFVRGAVQGWEISIKSTVPNVLMAFVIIKILQHAGLLDRIGQLFEPVMALFGLPGEAAAALMGGWMSMGGGVGVIVALYEAGSISAKHIAVLAPAIFLMGSQLQYMGRVLGVMGIAGRHIPVIMAIPVVTAFLSMFVMNLVVLGS